MPLDKYKELGDKILLEIFGSTEIEYESIDISKVCYENEDMDKIRYVFIKIDTIIGNENQATYKKYTFLKENDVCKVSFINRFSESSEYKLDEMSLRAYKNYNNKPVEYVETVDLSKLK